MNKKRIEVIVGLFIILNIILIAGILEVKKDIENLKEEIKGNRIKMLEMISENNDTIGKMLEEIRKTNNKIESIGNKSKENKKEIENLSKRFEDFSKRYEDLQKAYENKSQEFKRLKKEMEDFEKELEEKMYWYSKNSKIERLDTSNIDSKCIENRRLNLVCAAYILKKDGYKYINEEKDKIKGINEFIHDKGGDCEDWALFMAALIREYQEKTDIEEIRLMKVSEDEEDRFIVYRDGNVQYYLSGFELWDVWKRKPIVVCFLYPGYKKTGHCILGLVKDESIENIENGVLVEAQSGEKIGEIKKEDKRLKVRTDDFEQDVEIIINSRDIYVQTEKGWISYERFIEKIKEVLDKE